MKANKLHYIPIILIIIFGNACKKETIETEEEEQTELILDSIDMLTPAYYNPNPDTSFILEVNQFISFAQKENFHFPLKDELGNNPIYTIPIWGIFGAGKGPNGTSEHHPAIDIQIENYETNVNIYAAHDGAVSTYKDADKYRHYISITKNIEDSNNQVIGKLVTIYAHIDLDLDEAGSINMNGQNVNKGDLISKHLYSETVGGPHLHFEIRYYRPDDIGTETYYSITNTSLPNITEPSAGQWIYGLWNPKVGYGFGNPINHGPDFQ